VAQYRGATGFYDVANVLLVNLETALAESFGGAVERACVVPGEIAWDSCNCGLLAISVRNWTLTDSFPDTSAAFGANVARGTPCDLPWLVGELHIQVIRCAPIPEGNAISVPCPDLDAAAKILLSDAYVTLTETVSTLCELREADQIIDYIIGNQETVGPAGDCVGSELIAQVGLVR
jgi:hypothetical protein